MSTTTTEELAYPELVEQFTGFFNRYYDADIKVAAKEGASKIEIDWADLFKYDVDLAEDLLSSPNTVLKHAQTALEEYPLPAEHDFSDTRLSFINLDQERKVGQLAEDEIGRFVSVQGQVAKLSERKPKPDVAHFVCQRCGTENSIPQPKYYFQAPYECKGCERKGPFEFKPKKSEWTILQQLRLKRSANETRGGKSPTLDVTLRGEQTVELGDGRFSVGSQIGVSGILDIMEPDNDGGEPTGRPVLRANGIEVYESDYQDLEIGPEETKRIEALAEGEEGDPYQLAVDSLAPTHHGDDILKESIALQMFAGVTAEHRGSTERGNIHILAVGDPGTGKSELLERVAEIAPNARFTDGKGTSKAGITAAAVPSDFGDEKWDLEAGVLPLSDNGVACIDEIDKAEDAAVESMHRAMAQQVVSVDKADIHAELRARAAVLAAGNPKYGRFDEHEPPQEQLELGPTILSRFDLIYPLADQPEEEKDRDLAEEMIENSEVKKRAVHGGDVSDEELERIEGPVEDDLLTKWAAYARQNVYPTLSDQAKEMIADLYAEYRRKGENPENPIPVTPRVVDSIIRLAEASARIRLSDLVRERDVERAKRLVQESIEYAGTNQEGEWDVDVVETNVSHSQKKQIQRLKNVIEDREEGSDSGASRKEVIDIVVDMGYDRNRVEHAVEKMKKQGEVYEPNTGFLRTS